MGKKPRIFSASSASNTTPLVLKFKRQHRKPYHAIEKNLKNPLKFKLIKKPPTLIVQPHQNKQEVIQQQPQKEALADQPVEVHPAAASSQILIPKKRGRPSKKPSALETIKDEPNPIIPADTKTIKITEEEDEDKPIKSPSPKRRMTSPQASTASTSTPTTSSSTLTSPKHSS